MAKLIKAGCILQLQGCGVGLIGVSCTTQPCRHCQQGPFNYDSRTAPQEANIDSRSDSSGTHVSSIVRHAAREGTPVSVFTRPVYFDAWHCYHLPELLKVHELAMHLPCPWLLARTAMHRDRRPGCSCVGPHRREQLTTARPSSAAAPSSGRARAICSIRRCCSSRCVYVRR